MGIPLTDFITALLIGIGLSMDASAVSMAGGANAPERGIMGAAARAAFFFGAFQGGMLMLGGMGGDSIRELVSGIDHWVAFFLLGAVAGKMLLESRHMGKDKRVDLLDERILVLLAVATSIDALAVGVGIAFADHSLLETAIIVAGVTALISFISVYAGKKCGCALEGKAEAFGGIVLALIGINILLNHLYFQ